MTNCLKQSQKINHVTGWDEICNDWRGNRYTLMCRYKKEPKLYACLNVADQNLQLTSLITVCEIECYCYKPVKLLTSKSYKPRKSLGSPSIWGLIMLKNMEDYGQAYCSHCSGLRIQGLKLEGMQVKHIRVKYTYIVHNQFNSTYICMLQTTWCLFNHSVESIILWPFYQISDPLSCTFIVVDHSAPGGQGSATTKEAVWESIRSIH